MEAVRIPSISYAITKHRGSAGIEWRQCALFDSRHYGFSKDWRQRAVFVIATRSLKVTTA